MRVIRVIAAATLALSAVAWTYRFIDDFVRPSEIAFYVLVPLVAWLLMVGPLLMLVSSKIALRVVAVLLLVPTGMLWAISILVGFFGLRIH